MSRIKAANPYLVFLAVFLMLSAGNFAYYQFSAVASAFMEQYGFGMTEYSRIMSMVTIPAILGSILAGVLVDEHGPKRVGLIAGLVTCLALLYRVVATSYIEFLVVVLLMGFSGTVINANSSKILGQHFSKAQLGTACGALAACNAIATTLATAVTPMLPSIAVAFIVGGVYGVVAVVAWAVCMPSDTTQRIDEGEQKAAPREQVSAIETLKTVARMPAIWVIGLILMTVSTLFMIVSSYLPTLIVGKGVDSVAAGLYTSIFMAAQVFGGFLAPVMVGKTNRIKLCVILFSAVGALSAFGLLYLPVGFGLSAMLFVHGFCIGGILPTLYTMPVYVAGVEYGGTALGIAKTMQLLASFVVPGYILIPIFGENLNLLFFAGCIIMLAGTAIAFALPKIDLKEQPE